MILAAAILLILAVLIGIASMFIDEDYLVYGIVGKIILNVIAIVLLFVGKELALAIITTVATVLGLTANFFSLSDSDGLHIAGGIMSIVNLIAKVAVIVLLFI